MKILNYFVTFITIITFFVLFTYNMCCGNVNTNNGELIILSLFLILNPTINLFRPIKRVIFNPIYSIVALIALIIVFFYTSAATYILFIKDVYTAQLKYSNTISLLMCCLFFLNLFGFIFKKDEVYAKYDKTNIILILLFIELLFVTVICNFFDFDIVINKICLVAYIIELFIIVIIFNEKNSVNNSSTMINLYSILLVLNILFFNPIGIFLSLMLYLNLDKYGTFL